MSTTVWLREEGSSVVVRDRVDSLAAELQREIRGGGGVLRATLQNGNPVAFPTHMINYLEGRNGEHA